MPDALPWDTLENLHPLEPESASTLVVIGAGLAGCWLARTVAQTGCKVIVLEAGDTPASGASSNPAGIVKPFVTRSPSLAMHFYVQAHQYLLERLDQWDLLEACAYTACGVVQLTRQTYPVSSHYRNLCPDQVARELGGDTEAHGLLFEQAGWLNPAALCKALLHHENIELRTQCKLNTIEDCSAEHEYGTRHDWRVNGSDNRGSGNWTLHTAHLALCSGVALDNFAQSRHLSITPARGQLSRFTVENNTHLPARVINGKHYVIPDGQNLIVGATFERGNSETDVVPEDDDANRQALLNTLPSVRFNASAVQAYAGVRATTPDRLPLVGPLPDEGKCRRVYGDLHHGRSLRDYPALPVHQGLFVLGGLGSRGIVTSALAASLLSDHILGGDTLGEWAPLLNPARFQIRALKRSRQQC